MRGRRASLVASPYVAFALVFIAAPVALIVFYSLTKQGQLSFAHFARFFDPGNPIYMRVLLRSVNIAVISTVICLILGYPMALILSRLSPKVRNILSFLFVLPMWMNFLLRTYAWMTLLEHTGVINTALNSLFNRPEDAEPLLRLMYTQWAVVLGNVYNFLPFMILPIYTVLIKLDRSVLEAARDLGANERKTFLKVILPLSIPGVVSGIIMTFMPALTTFIISKLLGGSQNILIGDLIETQFGQSDWGFGSAMSVILMVFIILTMGIMSRYEKDNADRGLLL